MNELSELDLAGRIDHVRRHELHALLNVTDRIQFRDNSKEFTDAYVNRFRISAWLNCAFRNFRCQIDHLRSTASRQLVVPSAKLSIYGHRGFAISGPRILNSLPDYLRDSELSIEFLNDGTLKLIFSHVINQSTVDALRR